MAILVPRTALPLEYAAETIREPGTRDVGMPTAVPKMIREAIPVPGISSGISAPKLTTRTGTTQGTTINPLAGAALGALAANIIAQRAQTPPKTVQPPPGTKPPPGGTTPPPGGGTGGGGSGGGGGGGFPIRPGGTTGGGYAGPVGFITQNPDGTITQTMDDGSTITTDENGNVVGYTEAPEDTWSYDPDSGKFYNSATGVFYDPETGTEEFGTPPDTSYDGNYSYDYGYDYSGYDASPIDPGYSYDYGYDYDVGSLYDYGYNYDPGYSYDYGYSYDPGYSYDYGYDTGDFGTGGDYGNYDYFSFFKKGGMATPMMKKGGVPKMSDGGDINYAFNLLDSVDPVYTTMSDVTTTSDNSTDTSVTEVPNPSLPGQPGYGWRYFTDGTSISPQGEYYYESQKIYDPNVGFSGLGTTFRNIASTVGNTVGGALDAISGFAKQNPGTSGALVGALLSQVLNQSTGGGRENLGVDMSKFGVIPTRTTTFGVGAPRFLTYEQYGSQQPMPEMYGPELYRNLNAPGFNPVNPTPAPAQQQMARGGLASMASGGSTYYTYGTPVNPADNLAQGGQPMMAGDPPTVAGRIDYRHGSAVEGPGDGQSDDIPAMLADGEYVIDAETVAMLGNGSNKAGAKKLDEFRMNIRKHKRDTPLDKIPPASKSPLSYLKGAKNG